jgi:hypothetical protein
MKNLFIIFSLMIFHFTLICEVEAQEGWSWQNHIPQGDISQEISLVNDKTDASVELSEVSWYNNGPDGGYVNCVSVSKSNPNIIYIGTKQGIYKSENKGASWIKTGFPDYEVRSIIVSPTSPDIVFAGTFRYGFWKSSNGGIDWVFRGLSGNTINCITIDSNDPNVVYFGSGETMTGTDNERIGIFRSIDGGETFNSILEWANWGVAGLSQVNAIFVDAENSDNMFVGGATSAYSSSFGPFLYSTDNGANWFYKKIGTQSSGEIRNLVVAKDSVGQKVVYVMAKDAYNPFSTPKFYKTNDLGDNWEEVTHPYTSFASEYDPDVFVIDPNNSNKIYIGARSFDTKILTYKTDQDEWSAMSGSGLGSSWSICIDISTEPNPTIYLGSYYGGIYKRTIGVATFSWTQIVSGINASYINDIAVHSSLPDLAYACVKDEYGLFKTLDSGINWNRVNGGLPELVTIDPQNPSILYSAESRQDGSNYYIYKSINGGANWQQIQFTSCTGIDCRTLLTDILVHPTNSQNILVATRPEWFTGYDPGPKGFGTVSRTTDGGNTWEQLLSAESSALAIDPNYPDIIYSGKQKAGQIWKIENAWGVRNATEITPSEGIGNITDIELDNSSNVYVSTESGLWRYTAGNWTELTLPSTDITSLGIDRDIAPNIIYVGTGDNGVLLSNDGGSSWNVWNDGLKNYAITKLRIGGSKVWVGTEYGGVWSRNTAQSVSPPYLTHNTGNYKISIFQDGSFGHLSSSTTLGEGCQYRNNVDALFASGLIFGTQSAGYVNGNQASFGFIHDFTNTQPIHEVTSLDPHIDHISQTAYNDDGAIIPYGISVHQKAFSNVGDEFVILEFGFTSSTSTLDNFYTGIFADWDVGGSDGYSKNLGGYDQSRNLAYQYVNDGAPDPCYYGIIALSGMAGAKVTTEGVMRGTTLQRISVFENETINEIGDYRTWIGSGPFTLTPSDHEYVYFAFIAGTDLENLQANANAAIHKYLHVITDVGENEVLPKQYALNQNYPNPFNPQTTIRYSNPERNHILLTVYNTLGQRVVKLLDTMVEAGFHEVTFNASHLPSGVYIYRLQAGEFVESKKLLLLK